MSEEQSGNQQEAEPEPNPEEPVQETPEQPVQEKPSQETAKESQEKLDGPPEGNQEAQPTKEKQDEPKATQDEPTHEDEPRQEDQEILESIEESEDVHEEELVQTDAPEEPPKVDEGQRAQTFSSEGLDVLLSDMIPTTSQTQDFALPSEFLKESAKPKAKTALGSAIDIRRSATMEGYDKRMARYANTYRLESNNPFNVETVDKILKATMNDAIANMSYEPEKCLRIAKWASGVIRGKVKELEFERYKIIAIATIGEKKFQDMMVASRSLWDGETDRYSFYSTENDKVYAIALCFGIYYE